MVKDHTVENILPAELRIPSPKSQNILMHIPAIPPGPSERHGRKARVTDNLELHSAANGLCHAVGPAKGFHFQGILGFAPGDEAGFERVD
jgi:hypothetical protein